MRGSSAAVSATVLVWNPRKTFGTRSAVPEPEELKLAVPGLHNGITFIVTRRCPLQCEHCVMESGPWYEDHLAASDMKAWLDEVHRYGITRVSYSGGDPVLYLQDLAETVRHARDLGMVNSLFTSGFWAPSVNQGAHTLERLSGVDVLGLSTSTYHQHFVPLERVANAVVAAYSVGIRGVEVQISDFRRPAGQIEGRLRELLPESHRNVPVRRQTVFRAGRSVKALTIPDEEYSPIEELDKACPAPALTVEPDGLLRGCCSSLLALKRANPFILGDLRREEVASVLARAVRSKHYQLVKNEGLEPILKVLREDGHEGAIPHRAVNACDLCYQIYRQPEVAAYLERRLCGELAPAGGSA